MNWEGRRAGPTESPASKSQRQSLERRRAAAAGPHAAKESDAPVSVATSIIVEGLNMSCAYVMAIVVSKIKEE